jgi:hypothetical protein
MNTRNGSTEILVLIIIIINQAYKL